jgi:uncharacterized protein Usg
MDFVDIVISIVISVSVGIAILFYQIRLGKKVDNLIIKQNQIIADEFKREEMWKDVWGNRIISDLNSIKYFHQILHRWLVDYINNRSEVNRETLIFSVERLGNIINYNVQNLKENIPKIEKYLKDPLLSTQIIKQTDYYPNAFNVVNAKWAWEEEGINGQIHFVENMIKTLTDMTERMKNEITHPTFQNNLKSG